MPIIPKQGEKLYIDGGHLVNGKKSAIHMDYAIQLGLLPPGGDTNQVLAKISNEDYDAD
jgi:hypothetical protein